MKTLPFALVVTLVLIVGGTHGWAQAPAPASSRIVMIDLQRILVRSAAGVAARERFEKERAGMQREMDAKRQELEKLEDELQKKGPLMTAEVRRDRQDAVERKRREAARLVDDFRRELEKREQLLTQKMLQEVKNIIDRLGKQRGYYLVLDGRAGILYASAEADLTDEIIRVYDQETGAKGKK